MIMEPEEIKKIRGKLTQSVFAEKLSEISPYYSVKTTTIKKWESGERKPTKESIAVLEEFEYRKGK